MSGKLVGEALRHAPATLTPGERLVLAVLAEQVRGETRRCRPGAEVLEAYTGMTDRSIRRAITALERAGAVERIPAGRRADGTPVYAYPGQRAEYRILPPPDAATDCRTDTSGNLSIMPDTHVRESREMPDVSDRQLSTMADTSDRDGGHTGPAKSQNGGHVGPECRTQASALPELPVTTSSSARPRDAEEEEDDPTAQLIRKRLGCSAPAASAVARDVRSRSNVKHPTAWVRSLSVPDLARLVPDGFREATAPRTAAPGPVCGHCDARDGDPVHVRQRSDGEGRTYRCPDCHPDPRREALHA